MAAFYLAARENQTWPTVAIPCFPSSPLQVLLAERSRGLHACVNPQLQPDGNGLAFGLAVSANLKFIVRFLTATDESESVTLGSSSSMAGTLF